MERQVKGIFIPIEIWQAKDLSWNEKALLMEIDSFTSRGNDCYFSNAYISELLDVKEVTASGLIQGLIKKGYIRQVKFDGRRRYVESCIEMKCCLSKNCKADLDESIRQTPKNLKETNNISNKPFTNIPSFIPPTREQVAEYALVRGFIDPDGFASHFISYYSEGVHPWHLSNGKPMKDWKRAVITWEKDARTTRYSHPATMAKQATREALMNFLRK